MDTDSNNEDDVILYASKEYDIRGEFEKKTLKPKPLILGKKLLGPEVHDGSDIECVNVKKDRSSNISKFPHTHYNYLYLIMIAATSKPKVAKKRIEIGTSS